MVDGDSKVITSLNKRFGVKSLNLVYSREYSLVRKWTVGISRSKEVIALIRLSKTINRKIIGQEFIDKIREVGDSTKFKAVNIRIDSLGGDVLYYSSLWTEIRSLAAKKPVIASWSDLAMGA
ncbi:putative ClpP/crotonase-like domain-containing protein [Medicago truncatula]|uniref:Putative ClpP/crotonase-like domain-containing protein n=1 Tax=Medicago truncatula TaxID=3880 RepID=A0A396GFS9_MEDTR|nr:putative ClpP/crotonase-like domain-containing protein [Medicago truncatula]